MLLCDIPIFGSMNHRHNFPTFQHHSNRAENFRFIISRWPRVLGLHQTCHTGCYGEEIFNISVFYCLQRTAHYRHIQQVRLVQFSSFSSNITPSTVNTDHYVCCYINWMDILHNEIVLLLKDVSKGLLTNELSSIQDQSLVPIWLSKCNSNAS